MILCQIASSKEIPSNFRLSSADNKSPWTDIPLRRLLISVKLALLLKKYKEIVCTLEIYPYICSCYGKSQGCRGKNQRSPLVARVRSTRATRLKVYLLKFLYLL